MKLFLKNHQLLNAAYLQRPPCLLQNPQYDIKDSTGTLHSGITQTAAYYPYDHSLGQYQYDR